MAHGQEHDLTGAEDPDVLDHGVGLELRGGTFHESGAFAFEDPQSCAVGGMLPGSPVLERGRHEGPGSRDSQVDVPWFELDYRKRLPGTHVDGEDPSGG